MTRSDISALAWNMSGMQGFEIHLLTFAVKHAQVAMRFFQPKANIRALGSCEKCGMKGESVEAERKGE